MENIFVMKRDRYGLIKKVNGIQFLSLLNSEQVRLLYKCDESKMESYGIQ